MVNCPLNPSYQAGSLCCHNLVSGKWETTVHNSLNYFLPFGLFFFTCASPKSDGIVVALMAGASLESLALVSMRLVEFVISNLINKIKEY